MGLFSKKEETKKTVTAPPVQVPQATSTQNKTIEAPEKGLKEINNLIAPKIPGENSLNDIKKEVIKPEYKQANQENFENNNESEDSLFDISDIDFEEPLNNQNQLEANEDTSIDTNLESKKNMEFIKHNPHHQNKISETFYITTSQFKTLLEIIENVKTKVKESSENHIRLMDIKSEEDIEYENLRKNFQYIEDKLYEVDNLIFEK